MPSAGTNLMDSPLASGSPGISASAAATSPRRSPSCAPSAVLASSSPISWLAERLPKMPAVSLPSMRALRCRLRRWLCLILALSSMLPPAPSCSPGSQFPWQDFCCHMSLSRLARGDVLSSPPPGLAPGAGCSGPSASGRSPLPCSSAHFSRLTPSPGLFLRKMLAWGLMRGGSSLLMPSWLDICMCRRSWLVRCSHTDMWCRRRRSRLQARGDSEGSPSRLPTPSPGSTRPGLNLGIPGRRKRHRQGHRLC